MLEIFLDIPLISFSLISTGGMPGFLLTSLHFSSAFDFESTARMMAAFSVVEIIAMSQKQGITGYLLSSGDI